MVWTSRVKPCKVKAERRLCMNALREDGTAANYSRNIVHPRQTESGVDNNRGHCVTCRNALDLHCDGPLPPLHLLPKVEEGPLSAVCKCLCDTFAANRQICRQSPLFTSSWPAMPWWKNTGCIRSREYVGHVVDIKLRIRPHLRADGCAIMDTYWRFAMEIGKFA